MNAFRIILLLGTAGFACSPGLNAESHLDFLKTIRKIDVHTHERADELLIREVLDEDNWKYVTVCVDSGNAERTNAQREISLEEALQFGVGVAKRRNARLDPMLAHEPGHTVLARSTALLA